MIDVPVVQVVQVHFPVAAQRLFPMVQTVRRTIGIQKLLNTVAHVPVVQVELDSWCRREGDSRISQLLLLRNRWLPVDLAPLRGGFGLKGIYQGPVHRYRAGGRVHRDTAPIMRCISCVVMDKHASLHTGPHHNHHNHHTP